MTVVEDYLDAVRATRRSGAAVKETSYYPAIAALFDAVGKGMKPRVHCVIHVKNQGAGLPDGGFFTHDQLRVVGDGLLREDGPKPARGVLEVKGSADALDKTLASEQIDRYFETYRQVLVTNLWRFALVGEDADGERTVLERFELAPSERAFWNAPISDLVAADGERFVEYVRRVLQHSAPLTNPKDVAWFLAAYAREARIRVERRQVPALHAVRSALEDALGLRFEGEKGEHFFRSTLVQTLFYGVFSAWVLWSHQRDAGSTSRFTWRSAQWELRVPLIRALFEQLSMPSRLEPLGLVEVLDWTEGALNRIDRSAFFASFDEGQAVQYFYEPFLEAFDPTLRKQLGVWYTPPEVVRYMVERVDTVLREELGVADGFADPNVYVLDPCTGTGSFLVETLHRIQRTREEKGDDALGAHALKRAAMDRIFGFEILPAPFVVAHLQLGLLLQRLGAPLAAGERAGVFLTNALTGWDANAGTAQPLLFPELGEERDAAADVKRDKPILVVIGNPPYNAFSGVSPDEEAGLVEPYKAGLNAPVARGGWGIKKFNLDDLYVRFFRLAERRITEQTGRGVVCFISNFSYLSDPSFVVMRKRFLDEFDALWFDSLNGDSRETGKQTPDGRPDPSIFSTPFNREGIRVGTAIGLMVRKAERAAAPTVCYREFWGVDKRNDLLSTLTHFKPEKVERYAPVVPGSQNRFSFRPSTVSIEYLEWPAVNELSCLEPSLGILENRKDALVSIDRTPLETRIAAYFDRDISWETLQAMETGLTVDAARFVARSAREKLLARESLGADSFRRILVRPMDQRWMFFTEVRPIWNEPRPAYVRQCWPGNGALLTRRQAVANPEGTPFFYTYSVGAQHALMTDAYYVPSRMRPESKGKPSAPVMQAALFDLTSHDATVETISGNLSSAARMYLSSLELTYADANAEPADLIWMHVLAIGYSPSYLTENADGLKQDWPRIPLPAAAETLRASAALGREIADLLDTESPVPAVTAGAIRPELRVMARIASVDGVPLDPDAGDLALTVGWGHGGQAGITMPGKGRAERRAYADAERGAILAAADRLGIAADDAFARLGGETLDVYLNERAYWQNVPVGVWEFRIGGYQVVKKWLSYRERSVLGRPLTADEANEVRDMIRRLAAIRLLEPALDEHYRRVIASTFAWSQTAGVGSQVGNHRAETVRGDKPDPKADA